MTITALTPNLSFEELSELSGKRWFVNGEALRFVEHGDEPGCHPWTGGGEAIAFPLLSSNGEKAYFARLLFRVPMTEKRYERWQWLAQSGLHEVTRELSAAPSALLDTHSVGRPDGIDFDFTCSLCGAVPGMTWELLKDEIKSGYRFDKVLRRRCISDLVRATAMLEREGVIHGDLSPANIIINPTASPMETALYVIDFDTFVASNEEADVSRLTAAEGGSYGTEGYCPPSLSSLVGVKDDELAPYSDRFGRDMLILELLCFDEQVRYDHEQPISNWDRSDIRRQLSRTPQAMRFQYFMKEDVFDLDEDDRPDSEVLARWTRTTLPPRIAEMAGENAEHGWARRAGEQFQGWMRGRAGTVSLILDYYMIAVWFVGTAALLLSALEGLTSAAESDLQDGPVFGGVFVVCKVIVVAVFLGKTVSCISNLAFSRDEPHLFLVGPFGFFFPARTRLLWLTERTYRLLTATALTVFTTVAAAMTTYLYR